METKQVLTWISHNHELIVTALIACLIGMCSIVHSIFKGIRDIIYAFKGIKKKEKPTIDFNDEA
jgi:hypothetical protein